MTSKGNADDRIRRLLPLRVSDDLTVDEAEAVDQHVRYDESARRELDAYAGCLDVLRESSAQPLPVDGRGSLWERIEPRLGPAGRLRRRPLGWVATWQLAAACLATVTLTVFLENRPDGAPRMRPSANPMRASPVAVDYDRFIRPLLGVEVRPVSRELAARMGLQSESGAEVVKVIRGSAADRFGLRTGDVIIAVDRMPVWSPESLGATIRGLQAGDTVELLLLRGGRRIRVDALLGPARSSHDTLRPSGRFRQDRLLPDDGARTVVWKPSFA